MKNSSNSVSRFALLTLIGALIGTSIFALSGCSSSIDPGADIHNLSIPEGIIYNTFKVNRFFESYGTEISGQEHTLISSTRATPNVSTNGHVVYVVGSSIEVINLKQGTLVSSISTPDGDDILYNSAIISPEGTKIAFTLSSADGVSTPKVFVANLDGSELIAIPVPTTDASRPQFSPDGKRLAFTTSSRSASNSVQMHIINVDGTGLITIPVTSQSNIDIDIVSFSPTGDHIAFLLYDSPSTDSDFSPPVPFWLNVLDIEEQSIEQISKINGGGGLQVDWSPDGGSLVYNTFEDNSGIYIASVDGSSNQKIAEGQGADWSPDGTQIAYQSSIDGRFSLALYNLDRSESLFLPSEHNAGSPKWSPDGTALLYTEIPSFYRERKPSLVVMDVETEQRTVLFTADSREVSVTAFWY